MVVYNITMKVEPQIEQEWLKWQKNEHIPEVMSTGLFSEYKLFRLLEQDDEEGVTYVIQYFTSSIDQYKKYVDQFSLQLRKKTVDKWGDGCISFRSVMQIVN